jgi:hypothetical protein
MTWKASLRVSLTISRNSRGILVFQEFQREVSLRLPLIKVETFGKCSISFKIKAHEGFSRRNILNISRIKIRMQRRDWAKGDVLQRSRGVDLK